MEGDGRIEFSDYLTDYRMDGVLGQQLCRFFRGDQDDLALERTIDTREHHDGSDRVDPVGGGLGGTDGETGVAIATDDGEPREEGCDQRSVVGAVVGEGDEHVGRRGRRAGIDADRDGAEIVAEGEGGVVGGGRVDADGWSRFELGGAFLASVGGGAGSFTGESCARERGLDEARRCGGDRQCLDRFTGGPRIGIADQETGSEGRDKREGKEPDHAAHDQTLATILGDNDRLAAPISALGAHPPLVQFLLRDHGTRRYRPQRGERTHPEAQWAVVGADWRRESMSLANHDEDRKLHSDEELREVVDRHAAAVYRVALSVVHDPALADDVVQETMLKAWRSSPVAAGQEIPRAWLLRVARNSAISLLRTRREDLHGPDTLPEAPGGAETPRTVEGRAQLAELWEAMRHLDEDARALIVLKEVDGLSYEEIASALELPLPTVKTRLFRARKALKDELKEWR